MAYEELLSEAKQHGIDVYEKPFSSRIKGLYSDNVIAINKLIPTIIEKACVLAEELGHHHRTSGNILDQSNIENRQQENRARSWAYEKLVPLKSIVQAHKQGIKNRFELAEFLGVTEEFLDAAINRYTEKYGMLATVGNYTVIFEPLGVLELFD